MAFKKQYKKRIALVMAIMATILVIQVQAVSAWWLFVFGGGTGW